MNDDWTDVHEGALWSSLNKSERAVGERRRQESCDGPRSTAADAGRGAGAGRGAVVPTWVAPHGPRLEGARPGARLLLRVRRRTTGEEGSGEHEFSGPTLGSLQVLGELPPLAAGFDYCWLPYEEVPRLLLDPSGESRSTRGDLGGAPGQGGALRADHPRRQPAPRCYSLDP